MSLQRQHFLLNYFKCWSGRGLNLRPPARQSSALPTELIGQRVYAPAIHACMHEKKDAWFSISKHACGSVTVGVNGAPPAGAPLLKEMCKRHTKIG